MIPKSGNRFSDKIMPKQMVASSDVPHFPRSAPIEAYGKGGFAFADMSHRGSLLCLPDAIWPWPVMRPDEITRAFGVHPAIRPEQAPPAGYVNHECLEIRIRQRTAEIVRGVFVNRHVDADVLKLLFEDERQAFIRRAGRRQAPQ